MAEDGRDMLLRLPSGLTFPDTSPRRHLQPKSTLLAATQSFGGLERDFQAYPSPPMSDSSPPLRRPVNQVGDESLQAQSQPRSVPQLAEQSPTQLTILPTPVSTSGVLSQIPASTEAPSLIARDQHGMGLLPGLRPAPNYRNLFTSTLPPDSVQTIQSAGTAEQIALPVQLTPLSGQTQWRTVRPARRAKAHVASACVNCKRAHLSCDVQRPCSRCVAGGKEDTCFDVQHKKRGRPRLREDRAPRLQGSDEPNVTFPQTIPGTAVPSSQLSVEQFQTPWQQGLPSTVGEPETTRESRKRRAPSMQIPINRVNEQYTSIAEVKPFCLLDMEFNIIKVNEPFAAYLHTRGSVRGRSITDFLDTQSRDSMRSMKAQIHNERSQSDPAYLPPLLSLTEHEALQSITQADLEIVTRGFAERNIRIDFPTANGRTTTCACQIQLAKTNVFFVVLVLYTSIPGEKSLGTAEYSGALSQSRILGGMASAGPSNSQRPGRRLSIPSPSSATQHLYQPGSSMFVPLKAHSPSMHGLVPLNRSSPGYYQHIRQPMGFGGIMGSVSDPPSLPASAAEASSQTAASNEPRADRLQNLHLPPILGSSLSTPPLSSVLQNPELQNRSQQSGGRSATAEEGTEESPERERGKKRRLNIHEVLE